MKILVCAFSCLKDPDRRFGFGEGGEGGLGWHIVLQLSRFFDVYVLTHLTNKESIEKENFSSSIKFYYISLPKFLNFTKKCIQIYTYLWQIKAYFIAKKLHKEIKFDVFHHATYANDWMASFIGALLPIPYVRGPGGGAHRIPKEFLKTYSLKDRLFSKLRVSGQWIFKHDPFFIKGQNRAKAILVCNKEAFNALPQRWRDKAYYFPVNGISKKELNLFSSLNKSNDNFSIITAGKLIKIKNFDLAIKVFKLFNDKISNSQLTVIGDGPELNNLKKLSEKLDIKEKVVFFPWMKKEDLLFKINASDVFIFTSLRDGGGAVVVESMGMGTPVVCFDIAGPGFHIDESCGIKIKPENPIQAIRDLSQALEKLYSNQNLKNELSENARKKVLLEYDWDKLGERLYKIYQIL